jgi:hypothetical protein
MIIRNTTEETVITIEDMLSMRIECCPHAECMDKAYPMSPYPRRTGYANMPATHDIEHRKVDADLAALFEKMPNKTPAAAGMNRKKIYTSIYDENKPGPLVEYIVNILQFYHMSIYLTY